MRILALSDQVVEQIYSPRVLELFGKVDLVLGCGDLPDYYLEFVVVHAECSLLSCVPGNHDRPSAMQEDPESSNGETGRPLEQPGWADRPGKTACSWRGLGGSIRYRPDGVNQYTQAEMGRRIAAMAPRLVWHRLRHGHLPDILLAHAPPLGVHDGKRSRSRGFCRLSSVYRLFRPRYLLHGHSHVWRRGHRGDHPGWADPGPECLSVPRA